MTNQLTKPQILKPEQILKAFDGDFGEVYFDHKPTPDEILLIKLKLVAEAQRDDTFRETLKMVDGLINEAHKEAQNNYTGDFIARFRLALNQLAGGK